ncbi:MAG: DEAD/DEAH box helicase, partial [Candidatus Rokubacteria bacterium]|nr:DEAD/DEAH box helicase [Candidatus Rokubacteria bacterium]
MSPMDFNSLELPEPVMRGIRDAGFVAATPIQESTLPLALKGKDVAGQSQTGTGKTAVFLIAAFTRCLRHPAPAKSGPTAPRVLIIAPTRELVVQIEADARLLGAHTGLKIRAVYGGIDYNKQREDLGEACDILVGTPGRLIDYLKQHIWSPQRVEVLVIDEADRMFDMGFIDDVREIVRAIPRHRQTLLFSATMAPRIKHLAEQIQTDPVVIEVGEQRNPIESVTQHVYPTQSDRKLGLLKTILEDEHMDRVLVFTCTKDGADFVVKRL